MTRKIQLLAGVALIATLLTACSNQKFAFRKKIPVNHEESVVAKVPARTEALPDITVPEEVPFMHEPSAATMPVAAAGSVAQDDQQTKAPVIAQHPGKKIAESSPIKETRKLTSEKSDLQHTTSSPSAKQLIILGLIFLLAGVVISLVAPGIGYLVAVIGVVFIIVALILYLAHNL